MTLLDTNIYIGDGCGMRGQGTKRHIGNLYTYKCHNQCERGLSFDECAGAVSPARTYVCFLKPQLAQQMQMQVLQQLQLRLRRS